MLIFLFKSLKLSNHERLLEYTYGLLVLLQNDRVWSDIDSAYIYILKIEPFMLHALPPVPTARRIRELQYSLDHHHILKDVEFLQC